MSILRILNHEGDRTFIWDLDNQDSVKDVKEKFDTIIKEGYTAFRIDGPDTGELIRKFDPEAKEIITTAPMVGG